MGVDTGTVVFLGFKLREIEPSIFGDVTAEELAHDGAQNAIFKKWKAMNRKYATLTVLTVNSYSDDCEDDSVGFALTPCYQECFGACVEDIDFKQLEKKKRLLEELFHKKPRLCLAICMW